MAVTIAERRAHATQPDALPENANDFNLENHPRGVSVHRRQAKWGSVQTVARDTIQRQEAEKTNGITWS
jgi:hypothetical protein